MRHTGVSLPEIQSLSQTSHDVKQQNRMRICSAVRMRSKQERNQIITNEGKVGCGITAVRAKLPTDHAAWIPSWVSISLVERERESRSTGAVLLVVSVCLVSVGFDSIPALVVFRTHGRPTGRYPTSACGLVLTSRQVFTKPTASRGCPPIGPNKALKTHCGLADSKGRYRQDCTIANSAGS